MIDIEKLKPLLKDWVSEDAMADAILKVSEIDEDMDTTAYDEAVAENKKLREQNKKLTDIFFTGKKEETQNELNLPDEEESVEEEEDYTFDGLFDTHEYEKGKDKLNG